MSIISITGRAAKHLKEVLAARAKSPDQCLRLVVAPGGQAGLVLDKPKEEDKVIEINGAPVLLLSLVLVPALKGTTLDYTDTAEGPQLTLAKERRPNGRV